MPENDKKNFGSERKGSPELLGVNSKEALVADFNLKVPGESDEAFESRMLRNRKALEKLRLSTLV